MMQVFKVTVNGKVYDVQVEAMNSAEIPVESKPQAVESAPQPAKPEPAEPVREVAVSTEETPVPSPLAGTIMSVKVKEGDTIKSGQVLLTLEALKMENEIVAPSAGVVSGVFVQSGANVNVGDILVALKKG